MWIALASLLWTGSLGALTPAELNRVESLSFEISQKKFIEKEERRFRRELWSQTISFPVVVPLAGAFWMATLAIRKSHSENSTTGCRQRIRKLFFGSLSVGLSGVSLYRLYSVWGIDPPDPEGKWLLSRLPDWEEEAQERRERELKEIYRVALARDFKSAVTIEISFSESREIWTGLPGRAWVDGKLLRSHFLMNPEGDKIQSFSWRSE